MAITDEFFEKFDFAQKSLKFEYFLQFGSLFLFIDSYLIYFYQTSLLMLNSENFSQYFSWGKIFLLVLAFSFISSRVFPDMVRLLRKLSAEIKYLDFLNNDILEYFSSPYVSDHDLLLFAIKNNNSPAWEYLKEHRSKLQRLRNDKKLAANAIFYFIANIVLAYYYQKGSLYLEQSLETQSVIANFFGIYLLYIAIKILNLAIMDTASLWNRVYIPSQFYDEFKKTLLTTK